MIELQEKVDRLRAELSINQQELLSLKSIGNFLSSYEELSPNFKIKVRNLLDEYFEVIEYEDYNFDETKSIDLNLKYILGIGKYYSVDLGFKLRMSLKYALTVSILIDSLLLITGFLKRINNIPATTLIMLMYWGYLKVFYENKNRVYGRNY